MELNLVGTFKFPPVFQWARKNNACDDGLHWIMESGIQTRAEAWEKAPEIGWMTWMLLRHETYGNWVSNRLAACQFFRLPLFLDGSSPVQIMEKFRFSSDSIETTLQKVEDCLRNPPPNAEEVMRGLLREFRTNYDKVADHFRSMDTPSDAEHARMVKSTCSLFIGMEYLLSPTLTPHQGIALLQDAHLSIVRAIRRSLSGSEEAGEEWKWLTANKNQRMATELRKQYPVNPFAGL